MSSRIKVLSEETINQIAAGEVIENPASVVKELVENSLDAEADCIIVEIVSGGFQLIRISDNGIGMSQDDAILSFERHATSKVRKIEDLLTVRSMGFRGEALASIASISKMTMITSLKNGKHEGIKVLCEGGKIRSVEACPRGEGTTIEVKSLFYTVPARKKFQKSPAQTLTEIHKTVSLLALSRPDVVFKLFSQDKLLLETSKTTLRERINEVLGKEYGEILLPISYEVSSIKIEGFIGAPTTTRSNRTGQYLFVNQRAIYSSALSYAVSDGYGTMLGMKRYPVFVLQITLGSELLDVNVHPQKKEVRFKEEGFLKENIRKAVSLSLQGAEQQSTPVSSEKLGEVSSELLFSIFSSEKLQNAKPLYRQDVRDFSFPIPLSQDLLPWECELLPQIQDLEIVGIYRQYALIAGEGAEKICRLPYSKPPYQGLLIVDLHAVTARIYFESVTNRKEGEQYQEMQTLLFPISIKVTSSEAAILQDSEEVIRSLGIDMRHFGDNTFIIDACVVELDEERIKELLYQLIGDLKVKELSHLDRQKKLATRTAQMTSSRKKRYQLEEVKKMLSELFRTEQPYFCPLGKKIIAYMSIQDHEKLFTKDGY